MLFDVMACVVVAARDHGFSDADGRAAARASSYRSRMERFAGMPFIDIWHVLASTVRPRVRRAFDQFCVGNTDGTHMRATLRGRTGRVILRSTETCELSDCDGVHRKTRMRLVQADDCTFKCTSQRHELAQPVVRRTL